MMAQAKRIYILMVEVKKSISFFALQYFLKEIENIFFVFLSSYRNLKKLWKHCSHSISRSPKLSLVFQLDYELQISIAW